MKGASQKVALPRVTNPNSGARADPAPQLGWDETRMGPPRMCRRTGQKKKGVEPRDEEKGDRRITQRVSQRAAGILFLVTDSDIKN